MELMEKTVESRVLFEGKIITVRLDKAELPNGRVASREVVEHPGGVAILPLFDDGTVSLVRQFRYPFQEVVAELPAGKLERGEDHRLAALRELEEEVGASCGRLTYLGCLYSSPGFSSEVLHMYLAQELTEGACHPDEDEFLSVERIPFSALVEQVRQGGDQGRQNRGAGAEGQAAGTVSVWRNCHEQAYPDRGGREKHRRYSQLQSVQGGL